VKKVMLEEFIESMARVEDILKGINMLGELSDKTLAQLVSFGERFSAFIVAGALKSAGFKRYLCKRHQTGAHRFQLIFQQK
jgi:aspartokinase